MGRRRAAAPRPPRALLAAVAVVVAAGGALALGALPDRPVPVPVVAPLPASAVSSGPPPVADRPMAVLHDWDARRSAAWADGSVAELRALYVARSRAGAADVRRLRAYRGRGLTVQHLHTQLFAVEVVHRRPRRWVLRVTDRVVGGQVVRGRSSLALPRDAPSTRQVTLRRVAGEWRVAAVRPVPRGRGSPAWGARS